MEWGEFVNAGIILFAKPEEFLQARVELDEDRLAALAQDQETVEIREHLDPIERIRIGLDAAGPIGQLSPSQRFHWLIAPRSTVIQMSPVHSGLCDDPAIELDRLFDRLGSPAQ